MSGAGTQPAGTSGAGIGTPLGLPLPGSSGYTQNSDIVDCRALDTVARDYDVDEDTTALEHRAWTPMEQCVAFALTETKGRLPYARNLGDQTNSAHTVPTIAAVRGYVAEALRTYVEARQVEILDVQIVVRGNALFRSVTWRDLTQRTTRTSPPSQTFTSAL